MSDEPRPHASADEHPVHGDMRAVTTDTRLFRVRLWYSSALWVPVLAGNLLVITLALVIPEIDTRTGSTGAFPISEGTAQAIFTAIAGSMITFTGLVFSAIFIAAQIQTQSYSPRLAAQLRQDWVIMGMLVMSTATAAYAMFALASIDRLVPEGDDRGVPFYTVLFGMVLATATLAWFAALVQRVFENIQIGGILRTLSRRAWQVIDDVHPSPEDTLSLPRPQIPEDEISEIEHVGPPGVIAAIDRRAVLKLASATGAFVEVVPQVGEFITPRAPVIRLYDADRDPTRVQVQRVFVLARQRTVYQDPSFVIRILVDVAIRALSPAVNDPTTATQAIDRIEALLILLYERHPGPTYIVDSGGKPRGLVHAPEWIEYFELGTTEIRIYGGTSLQVHRRMRAMHEHLLTFTEGRDHKRVKHEIELLDAQTAPTLNQPFDIELAREADRLGLGSV